jgi:hypothetical protein
MLTKTFILHETALADAVIVMKGTGEYGVRGRSQGRPVSYAWQTGTYHTRYSKM